MQENGRLDFEKENTLVSLGIEELRPNARYSITKSDPDNAVSGCRNVLRSAGNASTAGGNALSAQVNALGASGNLAKAPDDVSTVSGNVLMHGVNGWGADRGYFDGTKLGAEVFGRVRHGVRQSPDRSALRPPDRRNADYCGLYLGSGHGPGGGPGQDRKRCGCGR